MCLLFVKQLFEGQILQALCWTLLHSLWQGLLLAIVAGIVILLTRKSGPGIRYNLLSALFCLFLLTTCFTFGLQLHSGAGPAKTGTPVLMQEHPSPGLLAKGPAAATISLGRSQNFTDRLVNYFNEHASFIVAIWFIIFSARLVRILVHIGYIQRIRYYRTYSPSGYWKDRLQELARQLKIKVRVELLESAIIKVPMMAGVFKPVILIPFSLLSQLPPEQVEAMLLHELAHIRRRDYFVNLIQSFAEILFFFNPGVLWISSLIREERENCCDDIAVGQTKSKKEFIHALVSFQEYSKTGTQYSIAFPGSGNHLLQRIKRIVYNDNKTLDIREKFFLVCCCLITGVFMLAFSRSSQEYILPKTHTAGLKGTIPATGRHVAEEKYALMAHLAPPKQASGAATLTVTDTIPANAWKEKYERAQADLAGQQARLAAAQMKITEQQKKLSEQYKLLVLDQAARQEGNQKDMEETQRRMEEILKALEENRRRNMEGNQKDMEENQRRMEEKLKALEENHRKNMEGNQKDMEENQRRMEEKLKALEESRRRNMEGNQKDMEENQRRMEEKLKALEENHRKNMEESQKNMEENQRHMEEKSKAMQENQILAPIIEYLFREKVITNKEELSFTLNNDELIVNGVKQPVELHRKLREKYINNPRKELIYSRKPGGGQSITIKDYK